MTWLVLSTFPVVNVRVCLANKPTRAGESAIVVEAGKTAPNGRMHAFVASAPFLQLAGQPH